MKRITVLLADDNGVVRREFRKILEREDDLEVVGEAKNGRQAVAMVKKLRPALVLMGIAMPLLNGLQATRQILKPPPPPPKYSCFRRTVMMRMSKRRPTPARWAICSNKPPLTVCAPRFGKSKRGTHSSACRFPAVFTNGIGKSRWIDDD